MPEAAIFLTPWEFSPAVFALCVGAVVFYGRGLARMSPTERPGVGRRIAFFVGWALIYFVMQTHYDYYSQHVFFIHRIQHLVLHHLGPFLVAFAQPLAVLARGLPRGVTTNVIAPVWRHPVTRGAYRFLQNPVVAPVLFVGLIYLWLTPAVHFDVMLSARYYAVMNWSMLLDGSALLVAGARSADEGRRGAHRSRRTHLGGAARDTSTDCDRGLHCHEPQGPLRRVRGVRARLVDRSAHRPASRRLHYLDSGIDDARGGCVRSSSPAGCTPMPGAPRLRHARIPDRPSGRGRGPRLCARGLRLACEEHFRPDARPQLHHDR